MTHREVVDIRCQKVKHECPGFLGDKLSSYDKEDLIKIIHILYDQSIKQAEDNEKYREYLVYLTI